MEVGKGLCLGFSTDLEQWMAFQFPTLEGFFLIHRSHHWRDALPQLLFKDSSKLCRMGKTWVRQKGDGFLLVLR